MTEEKLRSNIHKTAENIKQWAGDTEQLVQELSSFLQTQEETGQKPAEETAGRQGSVGETLENVMHYLEKAKEAMAELEKTENL